MTGAGAGKKVSGEQIQQYSATIRANRMYNEPLNTKVQMNNLCQDVEITDQMRQGQITDGAANM